MPADAELTGQIVRVYAPDRFTIWCLDDQRAYACYMALEGAQVGAVVRFVLSPDRRIAHDPVLTSPDKLKPSQAEFLVPFPDETQIDPPLSRGALSA